MRASSNGKLPREALQTAEDLRWQTYACIEAAFQLADTQAEFFSQRGEIRCAPVDSHPAGGVSH